MEFKIFAPASDYQSFDWVLDMALSLVDSQDHRDAVALCIKEIMSDVRDHQYHLDLTKPIFLSILVTNMRIVATIADVGPWWRHDGFLDEPEAEEKLKELMLGLAERGRGKYICALLASSLEYQNGGRIRILTWRR